MGKRIAQHLSGRCKCFSIETKLADTPTRLTETALLRKDGSSEDADRREQKRWRLRHSHRRAGGDDMVLRKRFRLAIVKCVVELVQLNVEVEKGEARIPSPECRISEAEKSTCGKAIER